MKRRAAIDIGADAVGSRMLSLYSGSDAIAYLRESPAGYRVYGLSGQLIGRAPDLKGAIGVVPPAMQLATRGGRTPTLPASGAAPWMISRTAASRRW